MKLAEALNLQISDKLIFDDVKVQVLLKDDLGVWVTSVRPDSILSPNSFFLTWADLEKKSTQLQLESVTTHEQSQSGC